MRKFQRVGYELGQVKFGYFSGLRDLITAPPLPLINFSNNIEKLNIHFT